ncbi:MAG TPA: hypothetical protein VK622_07970 [Puia sp.]|nr:hypothetical protein [Puia sp.]
MNFTVSDFIQLSIFLISLSVFAQKPVPLYLRLFPVYFFFLMIVDKIIEYTQDLNIHNNILLNIWGPFEFSFYFFVIGQVIVSRKVKKRILYATIAFMIFAFINLFFFQRNDLFNPINFTIGTVITVILCIYYFFELFQKTEAQSLTRLPSFWVVSAILFNVVLIFPIFALVSFMNSLSKENLKTSMIIFDNIVAIFNIISVLTYILYSIGFLCRIRTSKSTL